MNLTQKFKKLSFVFGVIVALIGFLVVIGWIGNIDFLKSISPSWISMKANVAISFLLAGSIMMIVSREKETENNKRIVAFFSFIIFLIGSVTMVEYVFQVNAGIDELLFKDFGGANDNLPPGRPSPFTAAYLMIFGFYYLFRIDKKKAASLFQKVHIVSGVIVLAALMSYLLGTYIIAGVSLQYIFVIHSTVAFTLLILSVLFLQPEIGIMKIVSSNTNGGRIIRKTLPLFIFICISLGWLRLKGEQLGYYNSELGISIFIIVMIIFLGYLLFTDSATFIKSEKELKLSEERLIKTNENLELAEEQANLGNWEFEVHTHFRSWSKQMFRIFELEQSERTPSKAEFLELVHPNDRAPIINVLDNFIEQKSIEGIIFRTNPQKITLKYLLPSWHIVKDEKGLPVKFFGTLQDITERVEAKEALKQREELFSKAFHSKVFGLAIVNKERRLVDINESLCNLIEYKREEIIGKTSAEIGMTDDPLYVKKRDELLLMLFQKGRIDNYALELTTRKGKPLDLLLSVEQLTLNGNSHWLISLTDETEKKKAAKEIEEAIERFELIGKATNDAIWQWDLQTKEVWGNDSFYQLYGMVKGQDNLNELEPYSRTHPDDVQYLKASLEDVFKKKNQSIINEFRFRMPDNQYRTFLDRAFISYNENGEPERMIGAMLDMTERKKAERELAESENRLRTILETEPECVKLIDQNGELVYMNPAGLAMLEADDFEMVKGRKSLNNIHDPYKKDFYKLVMDVFSGTSGKMEYEITGFKGTLRWMETHMVPLRDEEKKIISLLAVTRDITANKKAEAQLKESEQRLNRAEILGSLGHGYYDIKNNQMYLSDGLYKIFGATPETFNHTIEGLRSLIHPDDFLIQQEAENTMFEKGAVEVEFRIVRPSGEVQNVFFKTKLTINEHGEFIDSFTTALCVTERKKAVNALKESEEKYRTLVEQAAEGIFILDLDGNYMDANESACQMTGYTAAELKKMNVTDIVAKEDLKKNPLQVEKNYTGKTLYAERTIQRKDHSLLEVEVSAKLLDNGKVISILRDITERKKADAQIRSYTDQLRLLAAHHEDIREEERNRIGREIHDELGQLLTVLKMDISRLDKNDKTKEAKQQIIIDMLSQLDNCFKVIRKISHEMRPSILDDLGIIAALDWLADDFEKKTKIKTEFHSNVEELTVPPTHAIGLYRIFQESLTNVAKHADAKKVTGKLFVKDGNIELIISDDGKGFDKTILENYKTLGILGMRERTILMKGQYEIESIPGKGTDIKVTIPIA